MSLFDFFRAKKPLTEEHCNQIREFYKSAYDKAFDSLLKSTIDNVPVRGGRDVDSDAFSAVFSNHNRKRKRAEEIARQETKRKYRLTKAGYDSL